MSDKLRYGVGMKNLSSWRMTPSRPWWRLNTGRQESRTRRGKRRNKSQWSHSLLLLLRQKRIIITQPSPKEVVLHLHLCQSVSSTLYPIPSEILLFKLFTTIRMLSYFNILGREEWGYRRVCKISGLQNFIYYFCHSKFLISSTLQISIQEKWLIFVIFCSFTKISLLDAENSEENILNFFFLEKSFLKIFSLKKRKTCFGQSTWKLKNHNDSLYQEHFLLRLKKTD